METKRQTDWAGNVVTYALFWVLPSAAICAGALLSSGPRAIVWCMALAAMGIACVANAARCGRVHCRFTGRWYLALIIPVALIGSGVITTGAWAWWALGFLILVGTKIIWWASERRLGRYRPDASAS